MIRHDTTSLSILKDSSVLKKKSSDLKDLNMMKYHQGARLKPRLIIYDIAIRAGGNVTAD